MYDTCISGSDVDSFCCYGLKVYLLDSWFEKPDLRPFTFTFTCKLEPRSPPPPPPRQQLFLVGVAFVVLAVCNFLNTITTMREKRARSKLRTEPPGSPRLGPALAAGSGAAGSGPGTPSGGGAGSPPLLAPAPVSLEGKKAQ
jgi:hypothetical protein